LKLCQGVVRELLRQPNGPGCERLGAFPGFAPEELGHLPRLIAQVLDAVKELRSGERGRAGHCRRGIGYRLGRRVHRSIVATGEAAELRVVGSGPEVDETVCGVLIPAGEAVGVGDRGVRSERAVGG
jgi:hypothetical protein